MKKILIITNENDITADFIVKQLKNKKASFYRLNTNQLGQFIDLCFDINKNEFLILDKALSERVDITHIKAVYFRRPELSIDRNGLSDGEFNFIQNELFYTLEGLYKLLDGAFWLNNVRDIRNSENKIYQLLIAQKIGLAIPNSIITNNKERALAFYETQNDCIIKPIKSGLVMANEKEEGVIFTNKIKLDVNNAERIEASPIYLQQHIEKKGDIRITIVGKEIFPAFIHSQDFDASKTDWRRANHPLGHSHINIPDSIKDLCLRLTKELNLNFAAIDFILDTQENFIFLEINPNGQWAWIEKRLNYNISESIANLLLEKASC